MSCERNFGIWLLFWVWSKLPDDVRRQLATSGDFSKFASALGGLVDSWFGQQAPCEVLEVLIERWKVQGRPEVISQGEFEAAVDDVKTIRRIEALKARLRELRSSQQN